MLDALHADVEDAGVLGAVPRRASGMLLARRGLPGADRWLAPLLADALKQAQQPPESVNPREPGAGPAVVEWCRLADRAEDCRPLAGALIARAAVRPLDLDSAELVRGLLDAGLLDAASSTMAPIPGVPEALAAGLRGDWRAAAAEWQRIGALRAGAGAARLRRRRGNAGGDRRPRPAGGSRADRPPQAARSRRHPSATRTDADHSSQPRRPHRAAARRPRPHCRGTHQRGDRRAPRRLHPNRRPPRFCRARQARRHDQEGAGDVAAGR